MHVSSHNKILDKIIQILLEYKIYILVILIFSLIFIGINILKPYILSLVFDNGINKKSMELVLLYTLYFFFIMALVVVVSILYEYLVSRFANKFIYDIKIMFIKHIIDLPLSFYAKNSTGDIITRVNNDIEDIRNFLLFDITNFYQSILNFIGAAIFIGVMQWKILVANLLIVPILFYVLRFFRSILYKVSLNVKNSYSESNKELVEGFKNINELKAANFDLYFLNKQSEKLLDLLHKSVKSSVINKTSSSIIQFVINITYLITIGYGGYLIINGEMTTGILLAFITMRMSLIAPVNAWSNLYSRYYNVKASIDRLNDYYENEIEPGLEFPNSNKPIIFPDKSILDISDVTFSYEKEKAIFEKFSIELNEGEWIGIKGTSGVGKTTLFKLLLKLIKPTSGKILLGKREIEKINNRDWRNLFGYVSQTVFVINDTIRENIVMGRSNCNTEKLMDVIEVCCLSEEVENFPNKFDTNIDENGAKFSGGMLKRLMLGRAIILSKRFLLLDELFSSLDNDMSLQIMQNLKRYLPKETTILIISHRDSDFQYCDKIIDLKNYCSREKRKMTTVYQNDIITFAE